MVVGRLGCMCAVGGDSGQGGGARVGRGGWDTVRAVCPAAVDTAPGRACVDIGLAGSPVGSS